MGTSWKVLRYVLLAAVVAAIMAGVPQRLMHRPAPVKAVEQRPRMPQFDLPGVQGGNFRLADYRGHVVIVNFWATWCAPCREEMPDLVRVYDRYRGRGVEMVGIAMDDDPKTVVPGFVKQYKVSYPIVVPTQNFGLAEQIESIPTTLVIDRQGRVAKSYVGIAERRDLEHDVEQLLSEGD